MTAADRNAMYDTLTDVRKLYPQADLQLVAVGMGARQAVYVGEALVVTLPDESCFSFLGS